MQAFSSGPVVDELIATAVKNCEPVAEDMADADFRTQWKALGAAQPILREVFPAAEASPGGPGPVTRAVAIIEGMGRAGVAPGVCYAICSQVFGLQMPLRRLRKSDAWNARLSGDYGDVVLCHALTEETGGSDPLSMGTRAVEQPDGSYLLNGRKAFVTAAPVAESALVFARTTEQRGPFALTAFLVDLKQPGIVQSEPFPKMALTDVPMGRVDFTDVRLPADSMVSDEGAGLAILSTTTTWERALLLSYALGPMHRVLERTITWSREREHFGRKMGASHLVASRLSDMALALYRSRQLIYGLAAKLDVVTSARGLTGEAALAKISVAQDFLAFSENAAALGGVRSYVQDTGLYVDMISPMAASTYAGPNDLLRISIARELGVPVEN